ncbi:CD83 antigen [Trichomycterus rosablanca]|uniref:CD83 antigen n=1 Tax=Trichomycterus rosablanca TaxID=2290929 RepID=UPI002F35F26B
MSTTPALLLFLAIGMVSRGHGSSKHHEIFSVCGEDAVLRCYASFIPGVRYRSVVWYKVGEPPQVDANPQLTGLVMKKLTPHNSTVLRYKGFVRDMEMLGDSQSLVLPNVTLQDAGRYRCFLSAPLGHWNQNGDVHLRVNACPNEDVEESKDNDTLYLVLAIILLLVALLMLYVSYTCLKNTLRSYREKSMKETWLKRTNEIKNLVVKLESNEAVSRILPQQYV